MMKHKDDTVAANVNGVGFLFKKNKIDAFIGQGTIKAPGAVEVKAQDQGALNDYIVTLRTRFDETTTSPNRPKDAPLTPSPREVRLIDADGHRYDVVSSAGTSLMTPLTPASSYTTQLEFRFPKDARGLRLLIETVPGWPDRLVIGDENSLGHKKTYFAL